MEALAGHGIHFENLEPRDVRDMFALCQGCIYWEMPRAFATRPTFGEMLRLKTDWVAGHYLRHKLGKVARENGSLIAFTQFGPPELYPQRMSYEAGPVSRDAMLITCVFVDPHYRGKGLASELLWLTEEVAALVGFSGVEAFARRGSFNNPAGPIELYLRCGFRVLRGDEDFPLMRKDIAGSGRQMVMSAQQGRSHIP
jgi:GNAT superfamily N-acetyltransferase